MSLSVDNKTRVVVFDGVNTRVYTNPPNIDELKASGKTVLVNPLFSEVIGVPPHLWVYRNGTLTHDKPVIKNDRVVLQAPTPEKEVVVIFKVNKLVTAIVALAAAALGYICGIS